MKKTILCIDDIKTNLLLVQSIIEDLAGDMFDVVTAQSATEAFSILHKNRIDLILLDIIMPDIDGLEAARMIRTFDESRDIPIIFVTGKKDDETIENCYYVGGDDYVSKPFNHAELIARISFHIESREKDRLLLKEKEYAQNILDLQDNLIFVSHGKYIVSVNKSLLNFYAVKDIDEFNKKYNSITDSFSTDNEYFSLKKVSNEHSWLEEIVELSKKEDVLVKIIKDDKFYIFNIKVKPIDDLFIVSMTDITLTSQQSLEYKHEANYDALTKVYNRNMLQRLLDIKILQHKENDKKFCLVLLDIDHFKAVNDTHGHLVGDSVLVQLASLITKTIREKDIFARWGGEEFILMFDVEVDRTVAIVENIRKIIENEIFDTVKSITCSFGVAEFSQNDTSKGIIKKADDALYEAKETGRNKVCVYTYFK